MKNFSLLAEKLENRLNSFGLVSLSVKSKNSGLVVFSKVIISSPVIIEVIKFAEEFELSYYFAVRSIGENDVPAIILFKSGK